MNSAYQTARYQRQLDNTIVMPYWEYVSVNDDRTRASHAALNGVIKRYDDPFWQTFYPPIDYRCRCTVIARSEYYAQKRGIETNSAEVHEDREGRQYFDRAGTKVYPGKDFGYNVHRHGYRPNLDQYDPKIANQFAIQEMNGPEFKLQYQRLEKEYIEERKRLKLGDNEKIDRATFNKIRNRRRYQLNFTAGVIEDDLALPSKTVLLSDDLLLKQFNEHLEDELLTLNTYSLLPSLFNKPEYILEREGKKIFVRKEGQQWLHAIVKITQLKTLNVESISFIADDLFQRELKNAVVLKGL